MNLQSRLTRYFLLITTFIVVLLSSVDETFAQANLNANNLSNVRSADVTDEQLRTFLDRAKSENVTIDQAIQMAMARGLPPSEARQLKNRLEEVQDRFSSGQASDLQQLDRQRMSGRDAFSEEFPDTFDTRGELDQSPTELQVYGANLFRNRALNFTPNLNLPTPTNYQLGPGDQLVISIWGDRTDQLLLTVSPEGSVQLNTMGPVQVNGLTIERATERILNYLASLYGGLRPSEGSPTTFAEISLARVRTITINVTGEVLNPGSYSVSSLSTIFNVLYASGGPNPIGSYRQIRLIRNNVVVTTLDLYDFLLNSDQSNNIRVQDQDVIQVMPFQSRVSIGGEILREAIYELKDGQTLSDLVTMSGGFTSQAYARHVKVHRFTDTERRLITVPKDLYDHFILANGDSIAVDQILDRYENKVAISGAVWRPGDFELRDGMTLRDLIVNADGVRPDAFMSRGLINRLKPDLSFEQIAFSVNDVLNNPAVYDIQLNREDEVLIRGIQELKDEATVEIAGSVRDSGIFIWLENMTLEDLILKANGFRESASVSRIEISRRIKLNGDSYNQTSSLVENFLFQVDSSLALREADRQFVLQPYDYVYVYRRPDFRVQQFVTVEGEVRYPGRYAILSQNERISDIIARAGGVTAEAYVPGGWIKRLNRSIDRASVDYSFLEESDQPEAGVNRLGSTVNRARVDNTLPAVSNPTQARVNRPGNSISSGVSSDEESVEAQDLNNTQLSVSTRIGIDLENALRNPNSTENLFLREGDVIRVPKISQTVRVAGAVMQEVEVRYVPGASYSYYINRAGGLSYQAQKRRSYVVYANGDVDRNRRILGLTVVRPDIQPGAEIIVPFKPESTRMTTQEIVSISSMIISMTTTLLIVIDQLTR
jgi:protein involved in polysaccharide export with SLBB domain